MDAQHCYLQPPLSPPRGVQTGTSQEMTEAIPQEEDALSCDPSGELKFPVI